MAPDDDIILIDNRSGDEYAVGHIRGAVLIPYTEIGERIGEVTMDKAAPIYVYCRSGRRSGIAREELLRLGYQNVTNLGAMEKAAETIGRPIVSDGE